MEGSEPVIAEQIYGTKMAMVVVDPQKKFSLDSPDWPEKSSSAVEKINMYTRLFREFGAPVIFIHFDGESHCNYKGDDGDEWLDGIETDPGDIVVHKTAMNCFKKTELENVLHGLGADCILLTGMLSEFCVISTYFAAGERSMMPYIGRGGLISYYDKGNEAVELIASVVEEDVVRRFLAGEQPPMAIDW